jgi:hypothetical protein
MKAGNYKRLPDAQPMPEVAAERAEAVAFFSGMWHGLALGVVIGATLMALGLGAMR